ncbi:MAG TPA: hypothetical protein VLJ61_18475 [Pyrinomonadaceae bacterium]|nr:hypothetical protein [Pyrinomonadaceae bacterium]
MSKRVPLIAAALCVVSLTTARAQQTQQAQPKASAKTSGSKANAVEADPMAEIRRTTAISLVSTLANDAQMFRDPVLRARVQARAADALWDTERERSLALFRRAWDEAVAADAESDRRVADEKARQMRERGSFSIHPPPSMRTEVLRLAAKRDRALGEEFLKKLDDERKQEAENAATSNDHPTADDSQDPTTHRRDPMYTPPEISKRLRLATQLLQDGDTERALQFADPALAAGPVNADALQFLTRLRQKDSKAADGRYEAFVGRAALDPASDANTVSLLASYIFTPTLYAVFDSNGGSSLNSWGRDFPPPTDIAPQLRAAYFQVAASILLRPTPTPELDQSSSGRKGWYMIISRLLPLFDQFAPDNSAALHAKMASLAPDAPPEMRTTEGDDIVRHGLVPDDPNRDRVQDALNQIDSAKTSDERDEIYIGAIMSALRKNDPRVEELLGKIEDADLRRRLRAYVDFQSVQTALSKNNAAEVLRIAHAGTLTPTQTAWALTEAARIVTKAEPGRAIGILDEALKEAKEHIDDSSPERVSALVAIATQFVALDRSRAWDVMMEVVKASNAAKTYMGEDGRLDSRLEAKGMTMMSSYSAESFDLEGIFAKLASDNLQRAIDLARGFDGESPRAAATLAIVHSILDNKDEKKRPQQRAAVN